MESVDFPVSLVSIGQSAFKNCNRLTHIHIPENVTTISNEAFYGCNGIDSLGIPTSVRDIGDMAFYSDNLRIVYSRISDVFSLKRSVFSDETYDNATLYVPLGLKNTYQMMPYWYLFQHIQEEDALAITQTLIKEPALYPCYDIDGRNITGKRGKLKIQQNRNGNYRKVLIN